MSFSQGLHSLHHRLHAPWLFAILLCVGFFVFSLRERNQLMVDDADTSRFPQFYMTQVETREFDAKGQLHYQLITPQVTHFQLGTNPSAQDYTLIDHPHMAFHNASENQDEQEEAPWWVSADNGRSENNGELFRLIENVLIEQNTTTHGSIRITTSEMNVRTRDQLAQTDKAVNIRNAKGQMNAIGMEADFAQSRLQLKSQVKAEYEPR
jgi:lipopolysaccharide export system protein LptC